MPLLSIGVALSCLLWLFLVLPRLRGHLEAWEREYDIAFDAFTKHDFTTAEAHLQTAYELAVRQDSADAKAAVLQGLADVFAQTGRKTEAEEYCRDAIALLSDSAFHRVQREEAEDLLRRIQSS